MSTPAGQSDAQPLQDRHRSSDSCTSSAREAPDQRAVGQLLQHPRPAAGGVLLVAGGEVGRAHHAAGRRWCRRGTCRRRRSGARRWTGRRRRAGRRTPRPRAHRPRRRHPQVGVQRRRVDDHAGVEHVVGIEDVLDRAERGEGLGRVHVAAAARRAPARRRARRTSSRRARRPAAAASTTNSRNRSRLRRRAGSRCGRARSRRRSGRRRAPSRPCARQQRVELAQVGAELLGRHRGVLPARPGRLRRPACGRRARRRPRGCATAPRPAAPVTTADVEANRRRRSASRPRPAPRRRSRRPSRRTASRRRAAGQAPPTRHVGHVPHRRAARPCPRARRADAAAAPGTASAAVGHVRVAEHGERDRRRGLDEAHGRAAASQPSVPSVPTRKRARSPPVLGQQVLQRVAGHLPAEPAELGADHRQVRVHELADRTYQCGLPRARSAGSSWPYWRAANRTPSPVISVERTDASRCPPVPQRPRAPHALLPIEPPMRRPRVGRRVGPEAQPVRPGRQGDLVEHRARLGDRGLRPPGRRTAPGSGAGKSPGRCRLPTALPAIEVPAAAAGQRGALLRAPRTARRSPRRRAAGTRPRPARPGSSTRRWSTPRAAGCRHRPRPGRPGAAPRQVRSDRPGSPGHSRAGMAIKRGSRAAAGCRRRQGRPRRGRRPGRPGCRCRCSRRPRRPRRRPGVQSGRPSGVKPTDAAQRCVTRTGSPAIRVARPSM